MSPADELELIRVEGMTHRLIPSKFPVIGIYDGVASREDLESVFEIEALTNPRLRFEYQNLMSMEAGEWVFGEGATPVMAAICNPNPEGSRFADHRYGVYYAAGSIQTAQLESIFHTERVLRTSVDGVDPDILVRRLYQCAIGEPVPRITVESHPQMLKPEIETYSVSQGFARSLREAGAFGLHYPSVRDPEGFCVAIFRPTAVVLPVVATAHYQFHWDGENVTHVTEIASASTVVRN